MESELRQQYMGIKEFISKDRFANYIGAELLEAADGAATAKLTIKEHHLNGVDITQGGVLFTLADLAFAAAANSRGKVAVMLTSSASFIKATVCGETIYAKASEISLHKRIATYHVELTNVKGELIFTLEGTAYRKEIDIPLDK